jgi:hypothetical protein
MRGSRVSRRERQPGGSRPAADEALERVGGLSLEVILADESPNLSASSPAMKLALA